MSSVPAPRRFVGQVVLVTGAASGIGAATARLFGSEGARVLLGDLDQAAADRVAKEIENLGGVGWAVRLDVAEESSWEGCLAALVTRWGRLDVLVNCAGIAAATPVAEISFAEWRRVHAVNLDGVFLGTRAGIRVMRSSGGGSIVNIASLAGIEVFPDAAAYASSKAAVLQFSKVAAAECARDRNGIRVNVIAPGGVRTPMWKSTPWWVETEDEAVAWRKVDPQNSFYSPEEIAASVLELALPSERLLNGMVRILNRSGPPGAVGNSLG